MEGTTGNENYLAEEGDEGDEFTKGRSQWWHNMNRVVEDNKHGPWFT